MKYLNIGYILILNIPYAHIHISILHLYILILSDQMNNKIGYCTVKIFMRILILTELQVPILDRPKKWLEKVVECLSLNAGHIVGRLTSNI